MNLDTIPFIFLTKLTVFQQYPRIRANWDLTETTLCPRSDGCDTHIHSTCE